MKNILLTGAAGSIGYEALKQLAEDSSYNVTIIDLDTKKARKRFKPFLDKVTVVYGSINDEELMKKLIVDKDVVIHLAAIIPPLADTHPELTRKVNYYGTMNIVSSIKKYNDKCFLVFTSSVSVYGDRVENPYISVNDPLKNSEGDYYAFVKIETEKLIREAHINYTIFRLTGIMGRPDIDPLMFHMPLDTKMEIASTIDTARALKNSIEHTKELKGHIYNLAGGEKCRTIYRDFIINMFKIYGLNIKYLKTLAFAQKNFHCGYFNDSDELNKILDFQRDTLDSYYGRIKDETKGIIRFFSKIFSRPVIYFLQKKSEPLKAIKENDKGLINRFFKSIKDIKDDIFVKKDKNNKKKKRIKK
ncbi:MAG: NAD(P)-dependent oxidoreductase [Bacilli bacterium]